MLEFQLQHQSFSEYSGLISFMIDWFDLAVQGTLKSLFQHSQFKSINSLALSLLYGPTRTSIHDYQKNHSFDLWIFVGKMMSLLFSTLSRLHSFPSKKQVSFNFMAAVTILSDFGAQENKIYHRLHFFPFYAPGGYGTEYHDLNFLMLSFKPAFSFSSFTLTKSFFSSSSLSAIRVVLSFSGQS